MDIQSSDQREKVLLERLKNLIDRANKLLEKPELKHVAVNFWLSLLKVQLKRIYGPDIDIKNLIPNITSNSSLPPKLVLQQKLSQLNQFV